MAFAGGDYGRSHELWSEALPILEQLGEPREMARALGELGACRAAEGDSARLCRSTRRHSRSSARPTTSTGSASCSRTSQRRTRASVTSTGPATRPLEALRLQERIGDDDGIAISNLNMASLEASVGDLDAACRHLRGIARGLGAARLPGGALYALGIAAQIAAERGEVEEAGLLCGAFEEQFHVLGTPQAEEAERVRRVRERVAALVDLESLLERGRRLTLDEAVALVRDLIEAPKT